MNMFWREVANYRRATVIWTVTLSILVSGFLSIFPAFSRDAGAAQQILTHLPAAVRSALDLSLASFFTVYGFFSYLFTFVALAGAVQAMNLGVGLLSREDSGKTVDFLLTKPVSRQRVVTSKLLAGTLLLVATNLVFSTVALVMAKSVSAAAFSSRTFLLLSATLLLIQLFFLALGVLMSVIIPKIKSVIAISLPTVFSFFIIGTLGAIIGNDAVKYLSPFKFFDPGYIVGRAGYEPKFLMIEAAFILISLSLSYVIYLQKDIRATS
ncbi:MAG: ABC transporter permease subunit [Candidatus Saccharibacteria bacterium]